MPAVSEAVATAGRARRDPAVDGHQCAPDACRRRARGPARVAEAAAPSPRRGRRRGGPRRRTPRRRRGRGWRGAPPRRGWPPSAAGRPRGRGWPRRARWSARPRAARRPPTTSARATATRWSWPPDSSEINRSASSSTPTRASAATARSVASDGGHAPAAQGDGDVLGGGERGHQTVALQHEAGAGQRLALLGGHRPAVVRRLAGSRRGQPAHEGEQGGLARARRTRHRQHPPRLGLDARPRRAPGGRRRRSRGRGPRAGAPLPRHRSPGRP